MTDKPITVQQIKRHLRELGVETEIDFDRERLYVVALTVHGTRLIVDKENNCVPHES